MTPTRLFLLTLLCATLAALGWTFLRATPFDSDRVAAAETRMWKSYYGGRPHDLGRELIDVLQEQFDLSFADSLQVAQRLA